MLSRFPELGHTADHRQYRALVIGGTPWTLVYTLTDREVWIERIKPAEEWFENL